MDDHLVPTTLNHHPPKLNVLPKTFLQIILPVKWLECGIQVWTSPNSSYDLSLLFCLILLLCCSSAALHLGQAFLPQEPTNTLSTARSSLGVLLRAVSSSIFSWGPVSLPLAKYLHQLGFWREFEKVCKVLFIWVIYLSESYGFIEDGVGVGYPCRQTLPPLLLSVVLKKIFF